jgi:transposase InsO family protein
VNLKHKSDADPAIRRFIAKIKTQYRKTIHEFQINAGGEFKSTELTEFLKELGVNILTSVPHMHQQNGRVERFIRTIMDKSQAIHLESSVLVEILCGLCCPCLQLYPYYVS